MKDKPIEIIINYKDWKNLEYNGGFKILEFLKKINYSYKSEQDLFEQLKNARLITHINSLYLMFAALLDSNILETKLDETSTKYSIFKIKNFTLVPANHSIKFEEKIVPLESLSVNDYPMVPVTPEVLVENLKEKLREFKQKVTIKTPQMATELCQIFNECILLNSKNLQSEQKQTYTMKDETVKTLVASPKTGSAKSLTLKVYVSLLKNESSLIVLKQVSDAVNFCKDINSWSKNSKYARTHYAIHDANLKTEFHIKKEELCNYRAIIITHSLFIQLKQNGQLDKIKYYQDKPRDLVVIDERINTITRHTISFAEAKQSFLFIQKEVKQYEEYRNNTEPEFLKDITDLEKKYNKLLLLEDLVVSFYFIFQELLEETKKSFKFISENEWNSFEIERKYSEYTTLIQDTISSAPYLNDLMLLKNEEELIREQRANFSRIVKSICSITNNMSLLQKGTKISYLHSFENAENDFLSLVILDATAHINGYYNFATKADSKNLIHLKTTNPKRYDNLTIHIAYGHSQGRVSIYKHKEKDILYETSRYLKIANNICSTKDKLLVIGHKDFIKYLTSNNQNPKISFTHWGRHIGHNLWSDCNKVMVIGWNYLPKIEHYFTIGSAYNDFRDAKEEAITKYKSIIQTISMQQIADDLIQGISRGALRNTIDTLGNCPKTDVYIFAPYGEANKKIVDIISLEFEEATIRGWLPDDINIPTKRTKPQIKIDKICSYVEKNLTVDISLLLSKTVAESLEIPLKTMYRLLDDKYAKEQLDNLHISYFKIDGKSKGFQRIY